MKRKDDSFENFNDIFESPYYVYTKRMLCFFGQWPFQSILERSIRTIIFFLFASTLLIPMSVALILSWEDINLFMEALTCVITGYGTGVKTVFMIINTVKLRHLVVDMCDYWEYSRESSMDLKILHEFGKRGKSYSIYYFIAINFMIAAWISVPLSGAVLDVVAPMNYSRRKLVFQVAYGIDIDKYYTIFFIHATVVCYGGMQMYVAHDTLYIIMSLHACATIEILRYVHLMEQTCEWPLGLEIALNVLAMSCTGAMAVAKSTPSEDVLKFACLNFAQVGHLLCINLPGHWITQASSLIRDSAYNCNWYLMAVRSRRLIVLLIRRAVEPCTITAGKYYVMSMESFSAVLQMSMSYITMLSSMQ